MFDRTWNRVDDSVWKFQPSDGTGFQMPIAVGNQMPIAVGKEWRFENKAINLQNGTALARTGQSKVVAKEKITTSAGTFDAFKIETTIRQVNANDQTKAATLTAALWYAPSVNRWVRMTYKLQIEGPLRESQTEELTDYSRKP